MFCGKLSLRRQEIFIDEEAVWVLAAQCLQCGLEQTTVLLESLIEVVQFKAARSLAKRNFLSLSDNGNQDGRKSKRQFEELFLPGLIKRDRFIHVLVRGERFDQQPEVNVSTCLGKWEIFDPSGRASTSGFQGARYHSGHLMSAAEHQRNFHHVGQLNQQIQNLTSLFPARFCQALQIINVQQSEVKCRRNLSELLDFLVDGHLYPSILTDIARRAVKTERAIYSSEGA
ncbi:hypothetical protein AZ34_02365 [Hylemonella gracilis str. Niagara R]|uniref:Uncharacterized protein n=1 Tax=Hylemonella gracilis str. Niagara R TaxID=1458275 RepID=A0A016XKY2_9BURK|nr:hypothetical protein AZ34_02365 [Hylemonella gracilis str. Niagara R]